MKISPRIFLKNTNNNIRRLKQNLKARMNESDVEPADLLGFSIIDSNFSFSSSIEQIEDYNQVKICFTALFSMTDQSTACFFSSNQQRHNTTPPTKIWLNWLG